jgi:hypothetical protein
LEPGERCKKANPAKINGRHEETRTPDLYRVNFEVNNLKPFPYLAFPQLVSPKIPEKRPSFDGELMASFSKNLSYLRVNERNGDFSPNTSGGYHLGGKLRTP